MLFGGGVALAGSRNHVLDGGQYQTNPFAAARGDKSSMRPFAKLLWTHVSTGVGEPVQMEERPFRSPLVDKEIVMVRVSVSAFCSV